MSAGGAAALDDLEILVCSFRTGDLELFAVNPVTGDARNLTRSPSPTEKYPGVSPDGRRIAFISDRQGGDALYVMESDGSGLRRLAEDQRGDVGMPSWTADGGWIYFGLYGGGPPRMCRIRPDNSGFQVVGEGIDPAVSPDGRWISFRLCDEVYRRSGETSERAYKERRGDKRPVWIMGSDGSDPHVVEPLHFQTTIDSSRAPFLARRSAHATPLEFAPVLSAIPRLFPVGSSHRRRPARPGRWRYHPASHHGRSRPPCHHRGRMPPHASTSLDSPPRSTAVPQRGSCSCSSVPCGPRPADCYGLDPRCEAQ